MDVRKFSHHHLPLHLPSFFNHHIPPIFNYTHSNSSHTRSSSLSYAAFDFKMQIRIQHFTLFVFLHPFKRKGEVFFTYIPIHIDDMESQIVIEMSHKES